jgi:hypothetical protein
VIPVIDVFEPTTVRLIPTAYITEPALTPLADSDADLAILSRLEGLTSARLSLPAIPDGVEPAELMTEAAGYGYSYVNAAFCYVRPGGNRFNDERRGAWYAAMGERAGATARAEVIFHLTRELDNVGIYENITRYREVLAGFLASGFLDVRQERSADYLASEPAIAYPAGQSLARRHFGAGGNGIVYPSVRAQAGTCLVAFRPHLVQNIRLGMAVTMEWSGRREPEVMLS